MMCPACARPLTHRSVSDISVDACIGGCGGIWFDQYELNKFDETTDRDGTALLDIPRDINWAPPADAPLRDCPRCADETKMHQHFTSVKRTIEMDECPQCGGIFLDGGEIAALREEFATHAERDAAANAEFDKTISSMLGTMKAESQKEQEQVKKVGHALRFLRFKSSILRGGS